ncbi:TetR/AcrR family transcriptional regulator [Planomonospora sp. ID67723]|uniref:TetR/AcrR family transcriptional regulator n=1 Tax=Planomonospora sp. ID67723 TaxID=2738134 RepID=UPI0018C44B59|nr:TetR/AcrR family transcriptional regulator [Planomonospora sp. ID67723]MBG0829772.1 TetR/AcrR family transcriptional regulator [Planomonospora sp. ID67723]
MARPRAFDPEQAVAAALDTFWSRGYEGTSIGDLEAATGLNRSSLYQAFGSKRRLFDAAVERYVAEHVEPALAALESPGAGRPELLGYLQTLAASFRAEPRLAVRGCLLVNTMAELSAHDAAAQALVSAYRQRVTSALENTLRGMTGHDRITAEQAPVRARVLCATIMGALVTAHADPESAAAVCDALARDVRHADAPGG